MPDFIVITMESLLLKHLEEALFNLYQLKIDKIHIEHPENPVFGDFSTNLPLVVSSQIKQPPMEIAKNLLYKLEERLLEEEYRGKKVKIFKNMNIAQPGFINFTLSDEWLHKLLENVISIGENYRSGNKLSGQNMLIEYTDPNPFKVFHIGHLMTNCIGESLARIYEYQGANVKRANYQGDVGMHVAKSIWGMKTLLEKKNNTMGDMIDLPLVERMDFLGKAYALGAKYFEENEAHAEEIKDLNFKIFYVAQQLLVEKEGWEPMVDYRKLIKEFDEKEDTYIRELYEYGKSWSLEYFDTLYERLGTKFDYYFFESVVGEMGLRIAYNFYEKGIFEKSDGAIIFRGENHGLHTRVFVNSNGLPVYEAKDLGLAFLKYEHFIHDKSIIVTANDVNDYFKVVIKAMEQIDPEMAKRTTHIGHGMMRFKSGKMSSRTGDVISGVTLLDDLKTGVLEKMKNSPEGTFKPEDNMEEIADKIAVSAAKYAILKNGIGTDIAYDQEEALSLSGNTGPYILYTYTRAMSVLNKSGTSSREKFIDYKHENLSIKEQEYALLRSLYKFPECVFEASERLAPNLVASFIYELAQKYNLFYAQVPILNADEEERSFRLALTLGVSQVLKNGLHLLGIPVVDKM